MGKKYIIKVNGKMYEVEVEEMGTSQNAQPTQTVNAQVPSAPTSVANAPQQNSNSNAPAAQPTTVNTAPKSQPAPQTETEAQPSGSQGGEEVTAPMSGVILKVNVKPGDVVKDAQTLIVIEAMKMENEILAPHDGKIKEVLVNEGQQVEIDQPLLIME
jgi:biotin carboxyl carrier protein